ncbi:MULTISPECIES: nuclear transport factor 2 family protein [unclassified Sinorhizobium]|uniref:YybH family protein n=1 Tax=unclassified Sinorhizobium TaxID=2613772 RepID=UPI0035260532
MARPSDDIREDLRRAYDSWNSAFNRGDADAVTALYTTDAIVLPSSHAFLKGLSAIKDFWMGLLSAGVRDHAVEMLGAEAAGDIAYSIGKWSAKAPGEDGRMQHYEGTIVTIFRYQDDRSWKACLHIWN